MSVEHEMSFAIHWALLHEPANFDNIHGKRERERESNNEKRDTQSQYGLDLMNDVGR